MTKPKVMDPRDKAIMEAFIKFYSASNGRFVGFMKEGGEFVVEPGTRMHNPKSYGVDPMHSGSGTKEDVIRICEKIIADIKS